jgi:hypothetical protein
MTDSELPEPPQFGLESADASPADHDWVSELLGSLREQDPAIPTEVAARLDQALAGLAVQSGPGASTTAPGRINRWIAIAATAAMLLGGTALYRQVTSSDSNSGSAVAANGYTAPLSPLASDSLAGGTASTQVTTSARPDAVDIINGSAVALSKGSVVGPVSSALKAAVPPPVPTTAMADSSKSSTTELSTARNWSDCLVALGVTPAEPTAVITGVTFEGQTADVLVRTSTSSGVDIWVVASGCSRTSTRLLDHEIQTS